MADLSIVRCRLSKIQPLRQLFLQELNAQVRYDAAHTRAGAQEYILRSDGRDVGYGSVKDTQDGAGTIFEFYVVPPFRPHAREMLEALVTRSKADALECQTNDAFYSSLVRERSPDVTSDTILFGVARSNLLKAHGRTFRERRRGETVFEHQVEPVGDYVIDVGGHVVATGGFLLHYNPPFADVFMEVRPDVRRQGHGAFLVQEVIAACFLAARVPAARTGTDNLASQATLSRAGMRESGRMLRARIA